MATRSLPISLRVVAAIFIVEGACSALQILASILRQNISINSGVLALFIGTGLFHLRPIWRIWAMVFIWGILILTPFFLLFLLISPAQLLDVDFFGVPIGHAEKSLAYLFLTMVFATALWMNNVLTRQDVRRLFV